MDRSADSLNNSLDNSVDYSTDNPLYDHTVPSWVRLLDSPSFKKSAAPAGAQATPEESKEQSADTTKHTEPWYMSPIFDQPFIGYNNRFSQPEPALDYPFRQSATAYYGRSGQSEGAYDVPLGQHSKSDWTRPQDMYSENVPRWEFTSLPTGHTVLDQSYMSKSPSQLPGLDDHNNLPTMSGAYSFTGSNDHLSTQSRDQPQLLKPEEYLSGLQPTDSYSVKYARAPCGRCTRAVTAILVLMSLAIIGLAAALTTSVLMKKDPAEKEEIGDGHPVVKALVSLKILNKNFTDSMADTESPDFYSIANPYSKELDRLFLRSSLAGVYLGNKIVSLGPGSIKTEAELLFLATRAVQDGQDVENVIDSAQRAKDWKESDAREMGEFVVCGDCVTVNLDFTRVRELPKRPVLETDGSGTTAAPATTVPGVTSSTASVPETTSKTDVSTPSSGSTTVSAPRLSVSNSTPFLEDGHFVVACDVTHAGEWVTLTLGFKPDNSTRSHMAVIVTLIRGAKDPAMSSKYQSRVFAYVDLTARGDVALVMNVTMVTCTDRGEYVCRLSMQNGLQYSSYGRVALQELPSAPVIHETRSSTQWEATPVYVCSAKLGYPPGEIVLSVVKGDNETLERVPGHVTYQGEGCEATAELRLSVLDPLLLGNATRLVCQVFSEHLQLLDATSYSAFYQVELPHKLEIQTKSASVNEGLAAIRCRLLNTRSWRRLALLKIVSPEETIMLVSAFPDGTHVWTDLYLRHRSMMAVDISANKADLDVFIFSLKCSDEGAYSCAVQSDVKVAAPEAFLSVTATPSSPTLVMPMGAVEDAFSQSAIICHAKVGRPAGNLVLKIKNSDEVRFRELAFNERTTTPLSCTTEVKGMFYPGPDVIRNGSIVSCHVTPHESLHHVTDMLNVSEIFRVIPAGFCQNKGDRNVSHPTNCRHYVTCQNDSVVNTTQCQDRFCFDSSSSKCSAKAPTEAAPEERGACYPDKDHVSVPHPQLCHVFYMCMRGSDITQHCPTGTIYASNMACTTAVRESHCYKNIDASVGVRANATDIHS